MNWKYHLGRAVVGAGESLLRRRWFPLGNAVPWGVCWPYDVARCARTRELPVIFDVGANHGQTAASLRAYFHTAVIHCFEPTPAVCADLVRNFQHDPRTRVHEVALCDRIGRGRLSLRTEDETNSLLDAGEGAASCEVELTTVDDFCRRENIAQIDLLKIDVEGAELQVLAGAAGLLRAQRIRGVFAEVGFQDADTRHTAFEGVRAALDPHGLAFVGLYQVWRYPHCRRRVGFANALFWRVNDDA